MCTRFCTRGLEPQLARTGQKPGLLSQAASSRGRCREESRPLGQVGKTLEASASALTVRSMRLVSAYCKGYRRFYEQADMNLDPRLVCIVGPNAAGKSSFLKALTRLNEEFEGVDFERGRSHSQSRRRKGRGRRPV